MIKLFKKFWNWGWGIYHKNEEIWNYLIVGGLTTLVALGTYYACVLTVLDPTNGIELQIANVVSWAVAVIFAYFANRIFVFKSKEKKYLKEVSSFVSSRIVTLVVEMAIMFVFVTVLHLNDKLMKLVVQVIITILNYIFSKLFVFKKQKKTS